MTWTRRRFLQTGLQGAAALGVAGAFPGTAGWAWSEPADRPLKLLILGGTGFLGPHTVEAALARGHSMTLFNRGRTNTDLFPDLEKLRGDRDGDLEALKGREWDAVIDTSGYVPRIVRDSASLLADHVEHYVFISSISVYAETGQAGLTEEAPVGTLEDESVETVDGETYGPLKALCERAASEAMGGRATNVRPGLIVGPMDRTDRFTYWPVRVARGGEVLAPGSPDDPVQFIDVRDLGAFLIRCVEDRLAGAYNATSRRGAHTIGQLLTSCREVSESDATFTWATADFLEKHEVAPWSDMPVWVPPRGDYGGLSAVDVTKAFEAGLRCRDRDDTIRATLQWWREQPAERTAKLRAGVDPEREAEVLAAWHSRG